MAFVFGLVFKSMNLPLPWILGPVFGLLMMKMLFRIKTTSFAPLKNIGFSLLGIGIGFMFTSKTFEHVVPYILPYTVLTMILILISLYAAYIIAEKTALDKPTSLIGSAPGGLSVMIATSESLNGNTVLVTIFHAIRLLAVLSIIPYTVIHFFNKTENFPLRSVSESGEGPWWPLFIYVILYMIALMLHRRIPAAMVLLPMIAVGCLRTVSFPLFELPGVLFILAQLIIGVHLGNSINISDIKKAGKYAWIYSGLSVMMIMISFLFGGLLHMWTGMDVATAILSLAPGGLIEMGLTAKEAGADAPLVSSLQMVRLFLIVLVLPGLFKRINE
ncbi:AbrB family transcriptional regulator [Halobacillus yeomjeoni]|uniref:AbrB family transcriptional regulator n=1 Tax=Halobacillus yeomjeoni TaxID=311194 RepID=UPI001CD2C7EF|nr:AbrB family transcriptional regulator [Halobacillus yeomjeoni]MCA0983096.1 AbrB family transcriptional regulator [Halobacillus yeomjeoni]